MIEQVCLNEMLKHSAQEVFETMVFMDMVEAEPDSEIEGKALLGSITFTGGAEGCLAICCSFSCAKAIAANMLAMDPDEQLPDEDISDAIGEIANMVMGSLKSRLIDTTATISVSIPSVSSGHSINSNLGDGSHKVMVKVNIEDEYTAEFSLLYREPQVK